MLKSFKGKQFFLCGPVSSLTLQSLDHVCRFGLHMDVPQDWLGHLPRLQTLRIQTTLFQSKVITQHLDCWLLTRLVVRNAATCLSSLNWVYSWFKTLAQAVTLQCCSKPAAFQVQALRLVAASSILIDTTRPSRIALPALPPLECRPNDSCLIRTGGMLDKKSGESVDVVSSTTCPF